MNHNLPPFYDDMEDEPDELSFLLTISASILIKSSEPKQFLDWIAESGSLIAPEFAAMIDPGTGSKGNAFRALGLEIYQAMPLPDKNFRRISLPKPGRNESCYCGSGNKFKHCCLPLSGKLDLHNFNMLRFILDALPKYLFKELPDSHADVYMVADTASQWHDEGEVAKAVALLEPWFAKNRDLNIKLEPLFDELMDCYLTLDKTRKRKLLLDDVEARGDRALHAVALQRKSTMLADQGDHSAALEIFREAQRLDPDNLSLAPLEITLLASNGEMEQARTRAVFWVARLERTRNPDYADMISFLREVADNPSAALAGLSRNMNPDVDMLTQLFEAAPPVEAHYRLEQTNEGYMLLPERKIAAVEATWQKGFTQIKPSLTATQNFDGEVWLQIEDWLPVLESSPYAWQSFNILDDLAMAIDALPLMGMQAMLLDPLLDRAVALLETNLSAAKLKDDPMPWIFMENRPALRLLAHRAFRILETESNGPLPITFIKFAERLLSLNPNDNHGIREYLSRAYIECGVPSKTLDLSERYPDDFCGMSLNRILALYRLQKFDEASKALHAAAKHHAVAIKMLLAKNPKQPRMSDQGLTLGGKEEAWLYRDAHHKLWQQDGALEWLQTEWKKISRSLR
jgi:tetratricopeptide (TPR) repeat protein